ncbi:MAG: D-alanyl-D-alanine carboxypeptidase [Oscillospiraceae bacterium]|nr:D-alanyl-D-alanine carboxypeptidase [Oscillospiraceae bacterium]
MFKRIICAGIAAVIIFGTAITANAAETGAVGAKAAIVMEVHSGRVLFAQNEHEQLPIASTTKIMTSLLALGQNNIHAEFEVDEKSILVEGSSMGLMSGDRVTLYALAQGMLLSSGNDGANAAAVHMAGSLPAFADMMNAKAAEIGMKNSSFVTPSGLDAEGHYSTAYDMALLTRDALRNTDFAAICGEYRMRARYGNPPYDRWLLNHNKLLNYYEYAVGVKTGFTRKAGRCLVSAATRDGITLIAVTLNAPDDWNIHEYLYEKCFPMLESRDITEGLTLPRIPVAGGAQGHIQVAKYESPMFPIPTGNAKIEYVIAAPAFLYAPVRRGQSIGYVNVKLDGEVIYTLTLISEEDVEMLNPYRERKDLFARLFG